MHRHRRPDWLSPSPLPSMAVVTLAVTSSGLEQSAAGHHVGGKG
jgi:hypothetical protein